MSSQIDYAKAADIESVGGAIVFTILYTPLLIWFVLKSFTNKTHVHYSLALFCLVRVAAFMIRAILAGSESVGETLKLVVADQILFEIGYFSLLYSAYILVLDRMVLASSPLPSHLMWRLIQLNRRLFHTANVVAVVFGIVASSKTRSNGTTTTTTDESLHIASAVIFLVCTVLQAVQTIVLASKPVSGKGSIVMRYGNYILVIISLLLLVREIFATVTVKNSAKQNNEHFWYPLLAVPEILAVVLFSAPGLIPRKEEVMSSYSPPSTAVV